ncbi:MAG: hypothetical protein AAFV53_08435 [Myxococcota bacterium]
MTITATIWAALAIGCASDQQINRIQPNALYPEYGDTSGPHDTLWYIYDDKVTYETTSSPQHIVTHHGDPSLYWYEPSGAHGMVATTNKDADFATLINYIRSNAGEPSFIDEPLNFDSVSVLDTFEYATFTHVLCEFWVDPDDDPADYRVSTDEVDDGMLVLLNGDYVGHALLKDGGAWALDVIPGQTNAVVLILVDDAEHERYFVDVELTRKGVIIN